MTVIWGSQPGQGGTEPPDVVVPNVVGQTVQVADSRLTAGFLNLTAAGNMQGHAVSQVPAAGATAVYGSYVVVTFA